MVTCRVRTTRRRHKAMHGLTRTLVANMVEGVTKGFQKNARDHRRRLQGGERSRTACCCRWASRTRSKYKAPAGIKLSAPNADHGRDRRREQGVVGQVAAEIRSLRKPEPYKGKGVKYQGEVVRRKAGKAGGK